MSYKAFVLFCCPHRSGHTLAASILNAHPNAAVSNQLFILKNLKDYTTKESLFTHILNHRKLNWKTNVLLNYGNADNIHIIGDKTGHRGTEILTPELLNSLKDLVEIPVKFIHMVRNPYDNIATWTKKNSENKKTTIEEEFDVVINKMDNVSKKIVELMKTEKVLTIEHEKMVMNTKTQLQRMCGFLELDFNESWLNEVNKKLWKVPRRTRSQIKWNDHMKLAMNEFKIKYPWYKGYAYG